MTPQELMDAYDFEIGHQKSLLEFWKAAKARPSMGFVQQPPCKVLVQVVEGVLTCEEVNRIPVKLRVTPVSESDVTKGDAKLPFVQKEGGSNRDVIAVKHDDAEVDIEWWNRRCVDKFVAPAGVTPLVCVALSYGKRHMVLFDKLRDCLLQRVRLNATRGFFRYLRTEHMHKPMITCRVGKLHGSRIVRVGWWTRLGILGDRMISPLAAKHSREQCIVRDLVVGREALERLTKATWWDWSHGSTPFFWRWPQQYRKAVRDGSKCFVQKQLLPHYWKKQQWPQDPNHKAQVIKKLKKVRDRQYVTKTPSVKSLTGFFAVPKGESDIRMVYDATKCGLNAALWAPNFGLPTIDTVLRNADNQTWFGDIDLGEMFLNYFLDEDLQPYAGLDLKSEFRDAEGYERWERNLMGLRLSPFLCTQTFEWGADCIRGDRHALDNPFRWDKVMFNLPGQQTYNPTMPWVYKWDTVNQRLASFFETYIDDIRPGGAIETVACEASR